MFDKKFNLRKSNQALILMLSKFSSSVERTNPKYSCGNVSSCQRTHFYFELNKWNISSFNIILDGAIYSCGSNNKGQLGIGHKKDASTLQFVSALRDVRVIKVSGGWDFSLALSGSIYETLHHQVASMRLKLYIRIVMVSHSQGQLVFIVYFRQRGCL